MPTTKPRRKPKPKVKPKIAPVPPGDVLTLAEAAAYLRLDETAVLSAVREQQLPARQIDGEWRFLKCGLTDWLRQPPAQQLNPWLDLAGAFRDDPDLMDICREAYRQRGRPMTEDGE